MRSDEDRIELANAFVYTAGQQAQIVALMQPLHHVGRHIPGCLQAACSMTAAMMSAASRPARRRRASRA